MPNTAAGSHNYYSQRVAVWEYIQPVKDSKLDVVNGKLTYRSFKLTERVLLLQPQINVNATSNRLCVKMV